MRNATAKAFDQRLQAWLRFIVAHPWAVLVVFLLLTAAAGYYGKTRLGINADPTALLDQGLPFLQTERAISARFPVFNDSILLVLTSTDSALLRQQTQAVHARLQQHPELFASVTWTAGDAFFQQHAPLYQNSVALQRLADQLSSAQPLLALLQQQTNASSLFEVLLLAQQNNASDATAEPLQGMLAAISSALQDIADQHPGPGPGPAPASITASASASTGAICSWKPPAQALNPERSSAN